MVNLRSQKGPARKVIIEESSSEESVNEDSNFHSKNNIKNAKKIETVISKSTRGRKKKQPIKSSEDEEEFKVKEDQDQINHDSQNNPNQNDEDSYDDKRKKSMNRKQVKQEDSEFEEIDEGNNQDHKKKGKQKQLTTKSKTEKQIPKHKKIQVKTEDDQNSESEQNEEQEEDQEEIGQQQEIVEKKKRGRKPAGEQQNSKKQQEGNNISLEDQDITEGSQIKEKGRRGYKRCKNESCSQLIFIHQKVCPHCKYEHKMTLEAIEKKQKEKKEKFSMTFDALRTIKQQSSNNKKVKIKKKDQMPIQQIKKNALYLDEFNFEKDNFKQMFEESKKQLFQSDEIIQRQSDLEDNGVIKGQKPSKKVKKEEQSQQQQQQQQQQLLQKQLEKNIENSFEIQLNQKYDVEVQITLNEKIENVELPHFGYYSLNNENSLPYLESNQSDKQQQNLIPQKEAQSKITSFLKAGKSQDASKSNQTNKNNASTKQSEQQQSQQKDWQFFLMNIGYPVTCLAWNYANIEQSEYKDQYLAVGININEVSSDSDKIEIFRTMEAFDLLGCHRVGQKYEKESCVLIFQLAYDSVNNTYKEPNLIQNIAVVGSPLKIKWMPKYTTKSSTTISVLTSSGSIYFYSFSYFNASNQNHIQYQSHNNDSAQSQIKNGRNSSNHSNGTNNSNANNLNDKIEFTRLAEKQKPIMKLSISDEVILSSYDWLNNQDCDYIIAGDQIEKDQMKYRIVQYYNNVHMGQVLDLKFYPQSNQNEQILFATCGYDGLIKIFDIYDQSFPILTYESSLKSCKSIAWDIGGKYLLVNRDKQQFSQLILSFFSTSICKKVELNHFIEARQLQRINQDNVVTDSSSSVYSQYIFSSNENGKIFGNFTEQNRKISLKKIKKKSSKSEGFQICNGQFIGEKNQINKIQKKRFYNLHLNDMSQILLNKINVFDEDDDDKDNDKKYQENDDEIEDDFDQDNPKQSKKSKSKVQIEFQNIENRNYVSSLELSQSFIKQLGIKTVEKKKNQENNSSSQSSQITYNLESFLAFSNIGGILHISKIYT